MWINISKQQIDIIVDALRLKSSTDPLASVDCIAVQHNLRDQLKERSDPDNAAWRDAAEQVCGDAEIDGDAVISHCADGDAWVMAWVHVEDIGDKE